MTPVAARLRCGSAAARFLELRVRNPPGGGHGGLFLASVIGCEVEVSASSWSLFQRSPTECSVYECDREAPVMRRPWPNRCCRAMKKKNPKWVVSHCCVYRLFAPPYCCSDSQWGRADLRNQWELETSDESVVESRRWWVLISLTHTYTHLTQ